MAFDRKLNFRCDEAFEDLLHQKMEKAGFGSYSEFIREAIQSTTIKERCNGLHALIKEVNKIGVNLNQLTKHSNQTKTIDKVAIQGINETYKRLTILIKRFSNDS